MPDPGVRQEPQETGGRSARPPSQIVEGLPDRDLYEKLKAARGQPFKIYDDSEGRTRTFELGGRSARPRQGVRIPLDMRPTPLPPDQLFKAYEESAGFLQSIEQDHPILTNAILNNPNLLPLVPEIGMMLSNSSMGIDVVGGLLDAMPDAVNYASYAETMFQTPVQQMFWNDVASQFDTGAKDVTSYLFSSLNERGADRVASLAFAWLKNNPMETQEDQQQLLLRLVNWTDSEQQTELHDEGIFGQLDKPQEWVEENVVENVVSGLIGWLGDPEEAIRRSGLTAGQQASYQFGMDPDDAGWHNLSGAIDAVGEVILDPVSFAAGVGAGMKAIKTVPLGAQALHKGRLAFIAKSAIPIYGRRIGPLQTRSITARTLYAIKAKTIDQVWEKFGTSRAGAQAFQLLQEGNRSRFLQRFPEMEIGLSDDFFEGAKYLKSQEDMAELLKYTHVFDNMNDPQLLTDAQKALDDADSAIANAEVGAEEMGALQLNRLKAKMRVDQLSATPQSLFVVVDIPRGRSILKARSLYGIVENVTTGRTGHVANSVRRFVADATQGVSPTINYFDTRQGFKQIRSLLEHYGVEAGKKDELLNKFLGLDLGERQAFMLHDVPTAIGEATGNPLLRYGLVEFYRRSDGVQSFAPGFDDAVNAAGDTVHKPLIVSDMQSEFKFPMWEVDKMIDRYQRAQKLKGPLSLGRRGIIGSTTEARTTLYNRLKNKMGKELPADTTEAELQAMAFSWMGQGVDPRSWLSKAVLDPSVEGLRNFNTAFKKGMLATRAGQWAFKVVILEEQLRAHVFEMFNLYSKPLSYGSEIFDLHYLNKVEDWVAKQKEWTAAVRRQTLGGVKTVEEASARIRETFGAKAAEEILGSKNYRSVGKVDQRLASWMGKASIDMAQAKLIPGSNLSRRLRAWKINHASEIKSQNLLKPDFKPKDDLIDIQNKTLNSLFGDELATSTNAVREYAWKPDGMSIHSLRSTGFAWGQKTAQLVQDGTEKWALRRLLALAQGKAIPADLTAEAFMETSLWKMMKGNIRQFFPEEIDDITAINRYFDERLEPWVENLLLPFLSQGTVNRADFLDNLVNSRRIVADLNGKKYDIDLRSAGQAKKKLSDLMVDQHQFSATTPFPEKIAAVNFDFRYLDNSGDRQLWRQGVDKIIQLFGEDMSQVLNRRPAWMHMQRKYLANYRAMGIPDQLAAQLAGDKASKIVNNVFFDISEAPHFIKKVNNEIPFYGAMYEVLGTWTYKMPVAVGGYWPLGAAGFGRKIDRLMRAFVSTGLVRVSEEDGRKDYTLQLFREPDVGTPLGNALSEIGYLIRRTPENAIANILAVGAAAGLLDFDAEEALKMSEGGYTFTLGNPLDPLDFGVLSFAQAHLGLNPAQNWIVNSAVGRLFAAGDTEKMELGEARSLADLADEMEVDVDDLVRANRTLISSDDQRGIYADKLDPTEIMIPAGSIVTMPNSSLFENMVDETLFPFGQVDSPAGIIRGLVPGMWQHVLRGWGLVGTPSDEALAGDLNSIPFFSGGIDTQVAQNSQLLEAFYYLETTEGLFSEIAAKSKRANSMEPGEEADALLDEVRQLSDAAVKRATDMAGSALILRGLSGAFFPNTGRVMRQEMEEINKYWNSREFAEQLERGEQPNIPLGRIKSVQDIDEFFTLVNSWLEDDTGDDARAWVRQNHPDIFAYLQPKTFWGAAGVPPEITNYEDYLDQIRSGERKPVPLGVAVQRHLHAGIESDYWTERVGLFGNDPEAHVSALLDNIAIYDEMQDRRFTAHDALDVMDEMHGSHYLTWIEERGLHQDDTYESVENARDKHREFMDTLGDILELDLTDNLEPAEVRDHQKVIRTTMARLTELGDDLASEDTSNKNPYELAERAYWTEIYKRFNDEIDPIWDKINGARDVEEKSLLFEELKLVTNEWAGKRFTMFDREDVTYPTPLDVRWNRKSEDEKRAWVLQRATRPLEWLSLDDVWRIMEFAPGDAASFFPQDKDAMNIYTSWTIRKNEIAELEEIGAITETDARKMNKAAEETVHSYLLENGRQDELTYMNMWPIEQLYVLDLLPEIFHDLMPEIRFIKETLAAEGKGPGSQVGDQLLLPFYQTIMNRAATDQVYGDTLSDLGLTLFDEGDYDAILPLFIADDRGGDA